MKRLLSFIMVFSIAFCSCKNAKKENKETKESTNTEMAKIDSTTNTSLISVLDILGSYVGDFGTNKITFLITKVSADSISGRSIVGGNDRPFAGSILKEGDKYMIHAKEPGDDKEDGIFDLKIDPKIKDGFSGSWKPNKVSETVGEKYFFLERKSYKYLKDVGEYPIASQRLLLSKDLENLMKSELEFMRNEIFARHGYCFQKKYLRQQFENQDWYVPNTIDIKNRLTDIEKKNIAIIKGYEKYAEEYSDEFGR